VVASKPLKAGMVLQASDLKTIAWPADQLPSGAYATVDLAVGNTVFDAIGENEPVMASRLASAQSAAGAGVAAGMVGLAAGASLKAAPSERAPSERVRVATIGVRNQGKTLAAGLAALGDVEVGEVALDHLHLRHPRQVVAMTGDQTVDHPHPLTAAHELFDEMGTNEPGAAGYDVECHPRVTRQEEGRSAPISRILCPPSRERREITIIPLGPSSLTASSDLPGGFGRAALERPPIWSCSVRGFACHSPYSKRGALLPHHFTLTDPHPANRTRPGGIFSVPLSFRLP